jgi:hypothetical protein
MEATTMSEKPTLQQKHVRTFHVELCSQKTRWTNDNGSGEIEVVMNATLGFHESVVGTDKHLKVNFPTLMTRVVAGKEHRVYHLVPVGLKFIRPGGGPPRSKVDFAAIKIAGAADYVEVARPCTALMRALVETYLLAQYSKLRAVALKTEQETMAAISRTAAERTQEAAASA